MSRILKPRRDLLGTRNDTLLVTGWNPRAYRTRQRGSEIWNGGWALRCDACGAETLARTPQVRAGTVRCRCKSKRVAKELTGQTFGKLTVVGRASNGGTGRARWQCRCGCGAEVTVPTDKLMAGRQVSCGCGKTEPKNAGLRKAKQQEYFEKVRGQKHEDWQRVLAETGLTLKTPPESFINLNIYTDPLQISCLKKNHVFEIAWNHLKVAPYCRKCHYTKSLPELNLRDFVKSLVAEAEVQNNIRSLFKGTELHNHEVDIFIPHKNFAIEYHGLFWHSIDPNYPPELQKMDPKRHFNKRILLAERGIELLQVYSDEWRTNRELIESMLQSRLGLLTNRLMGRECAFKLTGQADVREFLNENHLMGVGAPARAATLQLEGRTLAVMTYTIKGGVLEISRFCTLKKFHIAGGFSKLLKNILKAHPEVDTVRSFVDLRYATGASLLASGFALKSCTVGWKWTNGYSTFNRLKCRANMDARGLSQNEHAAELKWKQIYDAGQALFEKKIIK